MSDNKSKPNFKKPRKVRRKSQLMSAAEVLQSLLQNGNSNPLSSQFKRWKLWKNWSKVVGETIAKSSMPVSVDGKQLIVWVNHSVQLQELVFMKKPLLEKINAYVGHRWISNIHFTMDRRHVPTQDGSSEIEVNLKSLIDE